MILNVIQAALEKYGISHNEPLVVGVSGGVDSMALLYCLAQSHDPATIHVVHVNHGLRGSESDGDEALVVEYGCSKGARTHVAQESVAEWAKERNIGVEEAGRIVRQRSFEKYAKETGARFVLLAHHLDDSVETVLFNFFRGSKLSGLSGIQERTGIYLRPFVHVAKSEIRKFAEENVIPYREDSSNASDEFLRNRIRNQIVPQIEAINPGFRKNILAFSQYAKAVHDAHESEIRHLVERSTFGEEEFGKLWEILQNALLERLYYETNSTTVGLSEGNLAELRKFVLTANGGTKKELGKLLLTKKNRTISWSSNPVESRP